MVIPEHTTKIEINAGQGVVTKQLTSWAPNLLTRIHFPVPPCYMEVSSRPQVPYAMEQDPRLNHNDLLGLENIVVNIKYFKMGFLLWENMTFMERHICDKSQLRCFIMVLWLSKK